jgi:hypothetical protein
VLDRVYRAVAWQCVDQIFYSIIYYTLSLTNSVLLIADVILLCTKHVYLIHDSHSHLHRKCIIICWFSATCLIWPPVLPLNLTYPFNISLATVLSEPDLCILLMCHIPNLVSISLSLGRVSKKSMQVQGPMYSFITKLFFYVELLTPSLSPKLENLPFWLWLIIQYILNYPQCLEAISSICNLRMCHSVVMGHT